LTRTFVCQSHTADRTAQLSTRYTIIAPHFGKPTAIVPRSGPVTVRPREHLPRIPQSTARVSDRFESRRCNLFNHAILGRCPANNPVV